MQDYVRHSRRFTFGSLKLSAESILAFIMLPLLLCTAAINNTCLLVVAITLPLLLLAAHYFSKTRLPQTRFFFSWALCSIVALWAIFEITVPLLELMPEENFIFRVCIFGSIFCFYRVSAIQWAVCSVYDMQCWCGHVNAINLMHWLCVCVCVLNMLLLWLQARTKAPLSFSRQTPDETGAEQRDQTRLLLGNDDGTDETTETMRPTRRLRRRSARALVHCDICQQFVVSQYHHSRWLNCCISDTNVGLFLIGCGLGLFGLLFGANLALTSICHPFFLFSVFGVKILLPDDCTDVFEQYKWVSFALIRPVWNNKIIKHMFVPPTFSMGLSFVGAIYATAIGICGLLMFIRQIYQILLQKSELKRSCLFLRSYICCYRL